VLIKKSRIEADVLVLVVADLGVEGVGAEVGIATAKRSKELVRL
jgi:hypothetical protein